MCTKQDKQLKKKEEANFAQIVCPKKNNNKKQQPWRQCDTSTSTCFVCAVNIRWHDINLDNDISIHMVDSFRFKWSSGKMSWQKVLIMCSPKRTCHTKAKKETKPHTLSIVSSDVVMYGTELRAKFLERWSVVGLVLPAAVHYPGDIRGTLGWRRHTIS